MNAPHPMWASTADVQAIAAAVAEHSASMTQALRAWKVDTHAMRNPTSVDITLANERYRIAYNASLRVYLKAIRDLDDGR